MASFPRIRDSIAGSSDTRRPSASSAPSTGPTVAKTLTSDGSVGPATNNDRRVFVSREVTQRVLDKCPDWQWRLVFALARYGGLRCPSEIALLKWSDIHWDAERFTVTSPKTQRYGKATRVVPIFPELRPFLDEAYFRDDAGKTWVVPLLAGERGQESRYAIQEDHPASRSGGLAETVSKLPI